MVLTAPLIDGVDDEAEDSVWVWHACRLGLVLKSIPTKQPSQVPQDHLHVTIVELKACRPLGSTSCAWIPLPATHSSTDGVAICRLSAVRGLIKI